MALPGVASLKADIEALNPSGDPLSAMTAFAGVIADYMDLVQAGPTGLPGILIFDRATFATQLAALPPVSDTSWIDGVASAWEAAVLTSVIVPGTVTDAATWTISSVDSNTLPSAAASILTIPVAKSALTAGLAAATSDNNPPEPMAQAFHDAVSAFQFNTIGVAIPGVPVPVPRGAQ